MTDEKQSESQVIDALKEQFGAEIIRTQPDKEDLQFLEERSRPEEMIWRYVDYVEYYDLIRAYGLDLKLMERIKWKIVWSLENNEGNVNGLRHLCIEECTRKPIDGNRH